MDKFQHLQSNVFASIRRMLVKQSTALNRFNFIPCLTSRHHADWGIKPLLTPHPRRRTSKAPSLPTAWPSAYNDIGVVGITLRKFTKVYKSPLVD